ncbi:TonB-dependent receptor domain-containing protein [Marivirga atlantica]|uniref:TonB-dependent receptor n=1 Tax=Marivirga atlantica TaxID=1548457 RepID=A0A937AER2_9BACT|nr:TonB-dependent receptor [Marivirga atlantica]MBL0764259.1 TonB-dependent receptor [Marivirga atlantica]
MRHFVYILFIFFLSSSAYTQGIEGYVRTEEGQNPIEGAQVFILDTDIQTMTDENGYYKLALKAGDYNVGVFYFERQSVVKDVSVEEVTELLSFSMPMLETVLQEVITSGNKDDDKNIDRLNAVEGTNIYEGKKNELIKLEKLNGNLATNSARQVFAKVPGLNIWESDAAGLQLGIGGRGLDPNRTSNFNTRQNGYDISADPLGYPESYYTPPMEALSRIEVVRGAASLQYGTQFGGMVNFVFKEGPDKKPFEFNTRNTVGSFGLFSSYNSVGGSTKLMDYFAYYQRKQGNGWRDNESFTANSAFANTTFHITDELDIALEFTHMDYLAQQPGGLNYDQFLDDPSQSLRERNWFSVEWNIPAITVDYRVSSKTNLSLQTYGLVGHRKALGNIQIPNIEDDFSKKRNLLIDNYENFASELRGLHRYNLLGELHALTFGARYFRGNTLQLQGDGPSGNSVDFTFYNDEFTEGLNYRYPNENLAIFAENIFNVSEKLSITPGIRYEYIKTKANGVYNFISEDNAGNILTNIEYQEQREYPRDFILLGIGASYKPKDEVELYANFSQNYRAITFNDMRVNNPNKIIDPDLKDESGYNTDLGLRGSLTKYLDYDWSIFYLNYKNKIAARNRREEGKPSLAQFIENAERAFVYGFESYTELNISNFFESLNDNKFSVFTNFAYLYSQYVDSSKPDIDGKRVEFTPEINVKSGLNYAVKNFSSTIQIGYVSSQFTESSNAGIGALNNSSFNSSDIETRGGVNGLIPSYYVMDFSCKYKYKFAQIEAGINNLTDNIYFTRRSTGYPGPGILPSPGRNFYVTLGLKF